MSCHSVLLLNYCRMTNKSSFIYNFIKTTYNISLNSQIYLLPLGFSLYYLGIVKREIVIVFLSLVFGVSVLY